MTFVLACLAAIAVWGILIYNRLVGDKNRVLSSWSDIDVQLKRRHDLIPKLVDAVQHYAAYEASRRSWAAGSAAWWRWPRPIRI